MSEPLRIGLSFWGFLGDVKMDTEGNSLSTPDGNAAYGGYLIAAMQDRGHTVFAMQEDRDLPAWRRMGGNIFSAFSKERRTRAYENLVHADGWSLPELDLLLVEWRFPIPGRNCDTSDGTTYVFDASRHQPDYHRQMQILLHYRQKKTKIVLWDLDHKLTEHDERHWLPDGVLETSVAPRHLFVPRTRVEPPCHVPDLLQHPTRPSDPDRMMVYVGSRYERDDVITKWVRPVSDAFPLHVHFYGNWLKTVDECRALWPNVEFHDRITTSQFLDAYSTAGCVPLLAKQSYLDTGFITPRVWEALLFGSIPVGLGGHLGVERYTHYVADDPENLVLIAEFFGGVDCYARDKVRRECVERLEFMDARHFVETLENFA